jgi:hypothetical protein
MTIAFLPIEIDVQLPDEKKLIDFCHAHTIPKLIPESKNPKFWDIIPVRSRSTEKEWFDTTALKTLMNNRYIPNSEESRYMFDIDKVFPEIPHMLEQLPFKEFTMVTMLLQTSYVPHHMDPHHDDVIPDLYEISIENEPHRYNIQLTHLNENAFFVSESRNGPKIYPNITKEKPCFAFCERYHWHGSDYIGENKIQLSVFGIVDRLKHKDMIIKNLINNFNEAILFPNPEDPWSREHHHTDYGA